MTGTRSVWVTSGDCTGAGPRGALLIPTEYLFTSLNQRLAGSIAFSVVVNGLGQLLQLVDEAASLVGLDARGNHRLLQRGLQLVELLCAGQKREISLLPCSIDRGNWHQPQQTDPQRREGLPGGVAAQEAGARAGCRIPGQFGHRPQNCGRVLHSGLRDILTSQGLRP